MLYKSVLSKFETESGLDFSKLEELLLSSSILLKNISDLPVQDIDSFFKLLIDKKQFQSFGIVIEYLEETDTEFNYSLVVLALYRMGKFENLEDVKTFAPLLKKIDGPGALVLLPFIQDFPEKVQKKIEASLLYRREQIQSYKEDLKEQIEFLKSQMLAEKALEMEEKLKFHFPEIKEQFLSAVQTHSKTEEQKFAKVIDRNLSLTTLNDKNSPLESARYTKHIEEDKLASLELAKTWLQEMKDDDIDLLLTQLEFLNFENPGFYTKVLERAVDAPIWTKIVLHLKSEQYFQGLDFLEKNEQFLLTDSPESIYNYYYTKGLLLLGAGMNKEAEEIFTLIKEQKGNFRDIQSLLQDAK